MSPVEVSSQHPDSPRDKPRSKTVATRFDTAVSHRSTCIAEDESFLDTRVRLFPIFMGGGAAVL
jgi:hypothetical protein